MAVKFLFFVFLGLALIFPGYTFSQGGNSEVHSALKKLKERMGDNVKVNYHGDGRVKTLDGKLSLPYPGTPEDAAKEFLKENAAIFQMDPVLSDMEIERMREDKIGDKHLGYYVSFKQTYKGLPVFDGSVGVNLKKDKSVETVSSAYLSNINISTTPTLSEKEVIEIAKNKYIKEDCHKRRDKHGEPISCEGEELILRENPKLQLGISERGGRPYLVYKILMDVESPTASLLYIIDANNGTVFEGGDMIQYFNGTGKVFDPNPVNTLNNTGLRDDTGGSPDADSLVFNRLHGSVKLWEVWGEVWGHFPYFYV